MIMPHKCRVPWTELRSKVRQHGIYCSMVKPRTPRKDYRLLHDMELFRATISYQRSRLDLETQASDSETKLIHTLNRLTYGFPNYPIPLHTIAPRVPRYRRDMWGLLVGGTYFGFYGALTKKDDSKLCAFRA